MFQNGLFTIYLNLVHGVLDMSKSTAALTAGAFYWQTAGT